jgi:DNA-directed RNA polymerase alpha subunit
MDSDLQKKLSMSIADLELPTRVSNCLATAKIQAVFELVGKTENDLLNLRSFGKTSLREVKRKLADMGLKLGLKLELNGTSDWKVIDSDPEPVSISSYHYQQKVIINSDPEPPTPDEIVIMCEQIHNFGQHTRDSDLQKKLSMSIADLELSVRASNCLAAAKIQAVSELVSKTENELLNLWSFGKTSLWEVKHKLADIGLELKVDVNKEKDKKWKEVRRSKLSPERKLFYAIFGQHARHGPPSD